MSENSVLASATLKVLARSGESIAVIPDNGAPIVLDRTSYELLVLTARFRPLSEHVAVCQTRLQSKLSKENILEKLNNLAARNLLRPVAENWGPHVAAATAEPRPRVSSIAVVTKDRPASLLRCIRSIISVLRDHKTPIEVCIYDDSEGSASRNVVQDVSTEWPGITLRYAGRSEKHSYLKELEKTSGAGRDVLEFALTGLSLGPAYGANLNSVLADTTGSLTLTVDDDMICQIAAAPGQSSQLAFSSDFNPTKTRLFPNRGDALASVIGSAASFVSVHESLLGRKVASCLGGCGDIDLENARSGLRLLTHPSSCKVVATVSGLVGDSGFQDCSWMHVDGQLLNEILQSEDSYRTLRHTSNVARFVSSPTISEGQFFMSGLAGIDSRSLLPPFMPVLRNQDGIFGCLLRTCWPDAMIGHVPWLAIHDPMPEYTPPRKPAVRGPRFADLMMSVIRECKLQSSGADPVKRLHRISEELIGLSTLDMASFHSWLDTTCSRHWASDLLWHQTLLRRESDRPQLWRHDLGEVIEELSRVLSENWTRVVDVAADQSGTPAENQIQRLFHLYGRLLQCWPTLIEASRELRSCGVRVTQAVSEDERIQVHIPALPDARLPEHERNATCSRTSCGIA